ncbi:Uncharacterised protein [uncultured archaeon]|nr:Uncharacterised protein [uncultured archaeon]
MAGRTLFEDASLATQSADSVKSLIDHCICLESAYHPGQPCSIPAEP